jgi:polyhydroxyalkanoate synthesis regulator phasin
VLSNSTSPEIEDFLLSQSKSIPSHKLTAIARELEKLEKKRELEEYREEIRILRNHMQELNNKGEPFIY